MKRVFQVALVALSATMIAPIAWMVLANAQGTNRDGFRSSRTPDQGISDSANRQLSDVGGRIVVESSYREVSETRDDGTTVTRRVPVQTGRWVPNAIPTNNYPDQQTENSQAIFDLKVRYSQTTDESERDTMKAEMHELLAKEFGAMHDRQATEIQQMRERVQKVQELHAKRTENKDRIIERRMEELLGTPSELQWNVQATPPVPPGFNDPRQYGQQAWSQPSFGPPAQLPPSTSPLGPYHPLETGRNFQPSQAVPSQTYPADPRFVDSFRLTPSINPPPFAPDPNQDPVPSDSLRTPQTINRSTAPALPQIPPQTIPSSRPEPSQAIEARIFDIHRNMSTRIGELKLAENKLVQTTQLRKEGAVPVTELRAVEADVERLKMLIAIDEQEMEWLKTSQQQVIRQASETLGRRAELSRQEREDAQRKIEAATKLTELIESLSRSERE